MAFTLYFARKKKHEFCTRVGTLSIFIDGVSILYGFPPIWHQWKAIEVGKAKFRIIYEAYFKRTLAQKYALEKSIFKK